MNTRYVWMVKMPMDIELPYAECHLIASEGGHLGDHLECRVSCPKATACHVFKKKGVILLYNDVKPPPTPLFIFECQMFYLP